MPNRLQDSRIVVHRALGTLWAHDASDLVVARIVWGRVARELRGHLRRSADVVSFLPVDELDDLRVQLLHAVDELTRMLDDGRLDRPRLATLIRAWRKYASLEAQTLADALQVVDLVTAPGVAGL